MKQNKPETDQDLEKERKNAEKGIDSVPPPAKSEEEANSTTPPPEKGTEETIGVP